MTDTSQERSSTKSDQWRERLAAQARSGVVPANSSVRTGAHGLHLLRLAQKASRRDRRRFALVEQGVASVRGVFELVLATGERLRIGAGADAATLRTVRTRCAHDPPAGQRAGVSVFDGLRHAQEL